VIKLSLYEVVPKEIWIPLFALSMLVFTYLVVPKEEFNRFFPTALVWGGIITILINSSMYFFKVIVYPFEGPFSLFGTPFWLVLAWPMSAILYLYFKPRGLLPYLLYLFAFCIISVGIDTFLHNLKVLVHVSWYPFFRFPMSIVFFEGSRIFYDKVMSKE
jgi:hypothetical protein